jgi:hypothetical protein
MFLTRKFFRLVSGSEAIHPGVLRSVISEGCHPGSAIIFRVDTTVLWWALSQIPQRRNKCHECHGQIGGGFVSYEVFL